MTAYAVYEEKGARQLPLAERVAALTLVRDGFNWGAFWLSGVWLAAKGHWLALALWAGALVAIAGLIALLGLSAGAYVWLWLAMSAATGLEAAGLERERLERADARGLGVVLGRSRADCEYAALLRLGLAIERERQEARSADA
jgi:hypothetical protein